YLSVNDAYEEHWNGQVRQLMRRYRALEGDRKAMSVRYVGSLVADFHRNLLGGGIFVSAEQEVPAREAAADVRGQSARVHRRAGGWVGDRRHAPHSGPAARRAAPAHAAVHRLEERRGPRV